MLRVFRDRVAKIARDACNFGRLESAEHGVAQETGSHSLAVTSPVHCQSSQNVHWNRVRHIALDSTRRLCMCNRAGRKRVVADNLPAGTDYLRA